MKNLLIVFLLFLSRSLIAQENSFTVSGKITGLDSKKMFVSFKDEKGKLIRDSILVKEGIFSYTRKIDEITMISISPNVDRVVKRTERGYFPAKSSLLQFIAFPGANVKFSGMITDFVNAYPSGDAANNDLAKLNSEIYPLLNESVNWSVKLANKVITDSMDIRMADQAIEKLSKAVLNIKQEFIKENPSSFVSAWTLEDLMLRSQVSNETAISLFENLDHEDLKAVPFYTDASKRVEGIRATAIGKPAPEINTTYTYDGKRFDLASLKGKYVVIDFWGTWCGPCIAGMPRMKEYLDKFRDKMEIVGVAQESDDGTRWKAFLDKNKLYQWHHVLSRKDEDYILRYSVAGFPTKIIVDPQGKIVARFVGEDEAIYKKLDEMLR